MVNTCPHCGASLRDNARFCPVCMTVLNAKRVIPTPKYALRRWLSVTAAVLVLFAAVGTAWLMPKPADTPVTAVVNTTTAGQSSATQAESTADTTAEDTAATESATAAESTTLTTLAESFGNDPTESATGITSTTTGPFDRVPSFRTTTGTTRGSTTTRTKVTTTTTKKTTTQPTTTTTTKKTTTQPTTTTTTKAYWVDATPAAVTEDGLPIEEVEWTYQRITYATAYFGRCFSIDYPNMSADSTTRTTTPSGVPINQCIVVTGRIGTTSNGIYRIPATIDGYVVAMVDFDDIFADAATALTVKRIYLPPDAIAMEGKLDKCTNLEGLYVTSHDFWLTPSSLPDCGSYWYGGNEMFNLTIYVNYPFTPSFIAYDYVGVWLYACKGRVYDAEAGNLTNAQCEALYGGGV